VYYNSVKTKINLTSGLITKGYRTVILVSIYEVNEALLCINK